MSVTPIPLKGPTYTPIDISVLINDKISYHGQKQDKSAPPNSNPHLPMLSGNKLPRSLLKR